MYQLLTNIFRDDFEWLVQHELVFASTIVFSTYQEIDISP